MRASFLSQERSDLSETVKRLAQGMSKPRLAHWEMLKRMARYLVYKPDMAVVFHQQKMPDHIRICVDSDYAGCKVAEEHNGNGSVPWWSHDQGHQQSSDCHRLERC